MLTWRPVAGSAWSERWGAGDLPAHPLLPGPTLGPDVSGSPFPRADPWTSGIPGLPGSARSLCLLKSSWSNSANCPKDRANVTEMLKLKKVVATFPHSGPPLRPCPRDTEVSPFPQLDGTWAAGSRQRQPRSPPWGVGRDQRSQTRVGWAEQRSSRQRCPDPPRPLCGSPEPRLALRTRRQGLSPLSGADAHGDRDSGPGGQGLPSLRSRGSEGPLPKGYVGGDSGAPALPSVLLPGRPS